MERNSFLAQIEEEFQVNPVVAILGPRQCGKTTVCKQYVAQKQLIAKENYFDLEDDRDIQRL